MTAEQRSSVGATPPDHRKLLTWINHRRSLAGLAELTNFDFMPGFDIDPVIASLHPEATYTRGSAGRTVQYFDGPGVVQIDLPPIALRFLREWRTNNP